MKTNLKFELAHDNLAEAYTFHPGLVLRRIRALKNIPLYGVKKGDLGGFLESESNLSQDGDCWVDHNAKVYGCAEVRDNALVEKHAQVFGSAKIHGNAWIHGKAKVFGNAQVFESGRVRSVAHVYGQAQVKGTAKVRGLSKIGGNSVVDGVQVLGEWPYVFISKNKNKSKNKKCVGITSNPTTSQNSVLEVNLFADKQEDPLLEALVERSIVREDLKVSVERLVQLRKVIRSFK